MGWSLAIVLMATAGPAGTEPAPMMALEARPPVPARPSTNPATWVTTADYPLAALRENLEGTVDFLLAVGPDGRVTDCSIRGSSGSDLLDGTTCELVRQRAVFIAAQDPAGRPVAGTYRNRVRWMIPRPPLPQAGELVYSFRVDPDGMRSDCRLESAMGSVAAAIGKADPCRVGRFSTGYVDEAGKPTARRVRMRFSVEVVPDK
ncbi:MAG: energy transducer TonB [Sphingomonadales bacterium]|nr:energy transducer TonB [Sphingomonadales bacterium]